MIRIKIYQVIKFFYVRLGIVKIVSYIFKKNNLYFTNIDSQRIGHLVIESLELILNHSDKNFIIPYNNLCNYYYKDKISNRNVKFINSKIVFIINRIHVETNNNFICLNYVQRFSIQGISLYRSIDCYSKLFQNIFKFDIDFCKEYLEVKYGILKNKKIIVIHSRNDDVFRRDNGVQSYRNSSFVNLIPSIDYLLKNDYCIVRIGEILENENLYESKNFFDLRSELRENYILTFILAKSSFLLIGNTSGISIIYKLFGKPVIFLNMIPFVNAYGIDEKDISLSKHYKPINGIRYLTNKEIFDNDISDIRDTSIFKIKNIEVIENNPVEILETIKFYLKNNGKFKNNNNYNFDSKLLSIYGNRSRAYLHEVDKMSDIYNYLTELSSIPNLDLSKYFSDSLLSDSEKYLFNCIIETMRPRNILEIGTYKCGTTHLLMEASKKYDSTVFSISPFDGEHVKNYLSRFPHSKIRFMIENSMAALSAFTVNNQNFDLIFIDGDHSFNACMYDLSASSQILNIGGLIIVDNISQAGPYYSTLEFINKNPNFSLISNTNNADFCDTAFSPSRKLYFDTDFAILYKKYFHCLTNKPSAIKYSRFNIEQVPILNFIFDENSIGSIVNIEIYGSMQSSNKSGTDFLLKIFDSYRIDNNSVRVELIHYSEFCAPNIDRYEIFIYAWSENNVKITNLELLNE